MSSSIVAKNLILDYPLVGVSSKSLRKSVISKLVGGKLFPDERPVIRAIDNMTFNIETGIKVGIIGNNGAGKSTLLKLISSAYIPTSGVIERTGSVISNLGMSVGLEPEATGYENIKIRCLLHGLRGRELEDTIAEVAEFTELKNYLTIPIKYYSTGMASRLSFSVITSLRADILLMDELIGTGDKNFIDKANARLHNFLGRSKTLVMASHSVDILRKLCTHGMLIDSGKIIYMGDIEEALNIYAGI
jgi:ABC-type polysaccharide/polyol phosphate transport system ATPase subunit